eukprot:3943122-Amphidinium_carterae.1
MWSEPRATDKLTVDESFFRYRRGREIEYLSLPKVLTHVDSIENPMVVDAPLQLCAYGLLSQLNAIDTGRAQERLTFGTIEASAVRRSSELHGAIQTAPAGMTWSYPQWWSVDPDTSTGTRKRVTVPLRHLATYLSQHDCFVVPLLRSTDATGAADRNYQHLIGRVMRLKNKEGITDVEMPSVWVTNKMSSYLATSDSRDTVSADVARLQKNSGLF